MYNAMFLATTEKPVMLEITSEKKNHTNKSKDGVTVCLLIFLKQDISFYNGIVAL